MNSSLRDIIAAEITASGGAIPFSRYMELSLYHSQFGYYSRRHQIFGKQGDFYTASDVHAVYAHLLSRQFESMWEELGKPGEFTILEPGAGSGQFAEDLLAWRELHARDFFGTLRYIALETSAALRQQQAEKLAQFSWRFKTVETLEAVPNIAAGCVFANEFFDALPVERFTQYHGQLQKAYVVINSENHFAPEWRPATSGDLNWLRESLYSIKPGEGEIIDISAAARWLSKLAACLKRGYLLVIDYGYTEDMWRAGRFRGGTLQTYHRHQTAADPFRNPGDCDITAHVNFTALERAAEQAGLRCKPLMTLGSFLINLGERDHFAGLYDGTKYDQERVKITLQLKHLISPAGMGEMFQVLVVSSK